MSRQPPARTPADPGSHWTFLTNHAHVLLCLAADPDVRLRDVATLVGITERAAQRILHDLMAAGYVSRTKVGRRNSYRLHLGQPLRHPLESGHAVRELISALAIGDGDQPAAPSPGDGINRRAPRSGCSPAG